MRKAINRGYSWDSLTFAFEKVLHQLDPTQYPDPLERTCIFISHQKEDTESCRQIADYLLAAGIDVYFDEYWNAPILCTNSYVSASINF